MMFMGYTLFPQFIEESIDKFVAFGTAFRMLKLVNIEFIIRNLL